jgi:dephospho-CoA kinase
VVECEPTLQIERLMARDKETRAQGERMVNTQASAKERRNVANILIPNSGDLEALESAVESALSRINTP